MYTNNRNTTINQSFVPERGNVASNNQAPQFPPGNRAYNQQQAVIPGLSQQHQQQSNVQQVEQINQQQGKTIQAIGQQNNANNVLATPSPVFSQNEISTSDKLTTNNQDNDVSMDSTNDEPKWKRKKVPGIKVNRKLKRLRMDQRLKKTLMPKNAIMVLNEMKSGVQFVFPETPTQNSLFLVHAQLDGKTYVGQGLSKPLARQNAAENALKCLVLEKMETAAKLREENDKTKPSTADTSLQSLQTSMSSSTNQEQNDNISSMSSMMDCTNGIDEKDDIPWRALANFALYKLLNEWQNQGTVVLMPKNGVLSQQPPKAEVQKQPTVKELPENPDKIHPVMLLNQMRPGITYKELQRTGNSPNILFTLAVDTDGQTFTGTAKNKKEAKKNVAINALKVLYNVVYPDDDKNKNDSMDITIEKENNGVLDGFVVPQKQETTNPVN
ncbi:hypothetical protein HCN44_004583 [Aphidius gifuensis]|uniref:DRBM domain-containing protein n=1 Tax=Aphidius gifuensis TaxID=684658 RepID=A0A834XYD4_APHGI|nr:spermatid perinuclear RNA-binding protein-like [Aphidius gifuensis]KAF7995111.1 hypothetical protein HCN44_004583 [Aphidius gifuensis]